MGAPSGIDEIEAIAAIVNFGSVPCQTSKPQLHHVTSTPLADNPHHANLPKTFTYPGAGNDFVIPSSKDFRSAAAAVAHTRTLSFLKPIVGGPSFDLEAIWEEHTRLEFAERAVEKTMATMVQEPYVNHVSTDLSFSIRRMFKRWAHTDHNFLTDSYYDGESDKTPSIPR